MRREDESGECYRLFAFFMGREGGEAARLNLNSRGAGEVCIDHCVPRALRCVVREIEFMGFYYTGSGGYSL